MLRRACVGSSCSKRQNSILKSHLPKCQRNASRSLKPLAFDKIRLPGWYRVDPLMTGFTCHDQKAVGLKQKIHVSGRPLRGKPHHTGREQAQGCYRFPKAGLAVEMAEADPEIAELLSGQQNLFAARSESMMREAEQLRGRITQINAQLQAFEAQKNALSEQIALVEDELARRQTLLEGGAGTREPVVLLQQQLVQLQGSAGEVAAGQAEAAERIIESELAILQLQSQRRERAITDLREVRVTEQELTERSNNLNIQISRMELRAPVAGRIHGLTIFGPGSVLRPADPLAFLIPDGRPLLISARVPAIDIDQVYAGQQVTLVFSAFDQNELPEITGLVNQVSADAYVDDVTGGSF